MWTHSHLGAIIPCSDNGLVVGLLCFIIWTSLNRKVISLMWNRVSNRIFVVVTRTQVRTLRNWDDNLLWLMVQLSYKMFVFTIRARAEHQ